MRFRPGHCDGDRLDHTEHGHHCRAESIDPIILIFVARVREHHARYLS